MPDHSQEAIAAIERALVSLRHSRPQGRGEHRGGAPWMRGVRPDAPAGTSDSPVLGHLPTARGYRGPHDHRFGGAARHRLLDALRERDRMSVSEIAEIIGVDQPRASRLVNDSAERGLVTRNADERDARRSVVELTPAGRAMLQNANDSRRSAVTNAVASFTPEETADFARLFTRFVENLGQ